MKINSNRNNYLKSLISKSSKHSSYQMIPDFVTETVGIEQDSTPRRADDKRYAWLKSHIPRFSGSVTDIGANLGYFAFRLLKEYSVSVTAYEPHEPHADAMGEFLSLCEHGEQQRMNILTQGVGLREIESLPDSDLTLFLNVIQHAGEDFDADLVSDFDSWRPYAVEYLQLLRNKTKQLFFQMGYTWLGHSNTICDDEEIVDFTARLLVDAGWKVVHCGLIHSLNSPAVYQDYDVSLEKHNPVALPKRRSNFSDRLKKKLLFASSSNLVPYRFAQRPLWLCERS